MIFTYCYVQITYHAYIVDTIIAMALIDFMMKITYDNVYFSGKVTSI